MICRQPSRVKPVPSARSKVESSPFDVRYGKFLGGNVNIVTKSGTNDFKGQVIGTFAADSTSPKLVSMPISAAQLGTADMSEITLDVDQTFTPGSGDVRELGIRVFHAFIEAK